eukprot:236049-Pyramimonas_sp.AAC.1
MCSHAACPSLRVATSISRPEHSMSVWNQAVSEQTFFFDPAAPTCHIDDAQRALDYFVASRTLAKAFLSTATDLDSDASPRYSVDLHVTAEPFFV